MSAFVRSNQICYLIDSVLKNILSLENRRNNNEDKHHLYYLWVDLVRRFLSINWRICKCIFDSRNFGVIFVWEWSISFVFFSFKIAANQLRQVILLWFIHSKEKKRAKSTEVYSTDKHDFCLSIFFVFHHYISKFSPSRCCCYYYFFISRLAFDILDCIREGVYMFSFCYYYCRER